MAVFHIKASFGSRAGGQSAVAKSDYIEREGRYSEDAEELEHKEHGNMPEWAEDDPGEYWEAADEHERANGRLYSEVQFALPKELGEASRRELAVEFAERVCSQERLPYTLAIHRGGANGENPHAHLMFSERGHDGIERDAEQWFRRYNRQAPEKGGARKSRAAKAGDWLEKTRKAWESAITPRMPSSRLAGRREESAQRSRSTTWNRVQSWCGANCCERASCSTPCPFLWLLTGNSPDSSTKCSPPPIRPTSWDRCAALCLTEDCSPE